MKRFIRYLYEYEQGKRIRNVGFVKVEAGNEETTLHMQGKGFHKSDDRKLALYLFCEVNGKIVRIRQAEMELKTPVLSKYLTYTADDVGDPENYSRIRGILVETESGQRIAATWDDKPVNVDQMEDFVRKIIAFSGQEQEDVSGGREEEEAGQDAPEMGIHAQPVRTPGKKLTKIQRQDLAKLPRCEWKLANNRFLMHGYNNYHHLILIEEGNILKLGVPGIYHIKEAKAADTFGFGEFLPIEEAGIPLELEEMHQDEPFGYWCRLVRKCGPINIRC